MVMCKIEMLLAEEGEKKYLNISTENIELYCLPWYTSFNYLCKNTKFLKNKIWQMI